MCAANTLSLIGCNILPICFSVVSFFSCLGHIYLQILYKISAELSTMTVGFMCSFVIEEKVWMRRGKRRLRSETLLPSFLTPPTLTPTPQPLLHDWL